MDDMKEKLLALLKLNPFLIPAWQCTYEEIADSLILDGVVVREKGDWEGTICSRCGGSYMDYADTDSYPAIGEPKPDFCPNCGADMRKGENG